MAAVDLMGAWFLKLLQRLVVRIGYRSLARFTLLFMGLLIFWLGLQNAVRELRGSRGFLLVLLALSLSWLVARWRSPGWVGAGALLLSGLIVVLIVSGNLDAAAAKVLRAAGETRLVRTGEWQWALDSRQLVAALVELGGGIGVLLTRFGEWLAELLRGNAQDPLGRALFWAMLLWTTAAYSAWALRRWEHPLAAFFPAGALLGAVTVYTGSPVGYVLLYLQLYLILQALQAFFARERRWEQGGFDAPDIYLEVGLLTLGVSLALVFLAMLIPSVSVSAIATTVYEWANPQAEQEVAGALGLQPGEPAASVFDRTRFGGLAREHLIGAGPELAEQPVFSVTLVGFSSSAADLDASTDLHDARSQVPLYWRGFVYDRYTGYGWATSAYQQEQFEAGSSLETLAQFSEAQGGVLRQAVRKFEPADTYLYYHGDLVAADAYYQLAVRPPADVFAGWIANEAYMVDAQVTFEDAETLRNAGRVYPDWVTARYLQLPDNIPSRVYNLALDLTAQEPTAYDRAVAIESYLRTFPYTLDLPTPPAGREIADYFLFELQRGYCDYYATAMVVLARAAGLPARLVVGYARGTWQPDAQSWLVTAAEAHSWVEVYFPGDGWVVFEPTAGREAIQRIDNISAPEILPESAPLPPLVTDGGGWFRLPSPLQLLMFFLGLAALGGAVFVGFWSWRLRRMPVDEVMGRLYNRLWIHARHLELALPPGATPLEVSRSLANGLPAAARTGEPGERLLDFLSWVGRVYSRGIYSQHQFTDAEKIRAVRSWLWLDWKMRLARWQVRWARRDSHSVE